MTSSETGETETKKVQSEDLTERDEIPELERIES
jgi:hypothetical protein